jgi:hypothetical protein
MPSWDRDCLDTPPGPLQLCPKARTPRTVLARFTDHRDVLARIGEERCFVKTTPRIRPAQQECSLGMALKDFRTALEDLCPECRLRLLRVRPSHNRTCATVSSLQQDGWTEPGAPGVAHDVVGDDINAPLAQATRPVSCAGTDFDEGLVPGQTIERRIAWDSKSVRAAEMLPDLQPIVLVVSPAGDHSIVGWFATKR